MLLPISFIDAFERWQKELGIFDEGYVALKNHAIKAMQALQKSISYTDVLKARFCLNEWIKRRESLTLKNCEDFLRKIAVFKHQTTAFCSSLIMNQLDPVLKIKHLHFQAYPYVLFYTHQEEIIFSDGYILLEDELYEVCFERDAFQRFLVLEAEKNNLALREGDLLDRGKHILEFRALKKGLNLSIDNIKALHSQKGDPSRQLSQLALKLQELEPGLNIEWAKNFSTLLNKLSE